MYILPVIITVVCFMLFCFSIVNSRGDYDFGPLISFFVNLVAVLISWLIYFVYLSMS